MKHRLFNRALAVLLPVILIIGLMPVTALAAGEIELYVGGQKITESGCYENQNGTWTKVGGTEPASGQFSYDAATGTLTLNKAEITSTGVVDVGNGTHYYYGSVIAFSKSTDVSLNVVLQADSTITGTGGIRVVSDAGDASLSISGPGSLEVKNVTKDSGITLIGSKDVNLNIDHADITISDAEFYGVHLFPGDECKITATVNDGNLTASGSNVGFYFSWSSTGGPSSLTVSGNAVVDMDGSVAGIVNNSPNFQIGAEGESGGIVFNGKNGTVYGDVTLQEDLEIGTDETLTVGKDASLTVPDGTNLTNNGTITNNGNVIIADGGTLTNNNGSIVCNNHIGGTATCTEKAKCSFCGAEYGDFLAHNLTKTEEKAATCTEDGNKTYWTCDTCGKLFNDSEGKEEIILADTVISATGHNAVKTEEKEATCTEDGNNAYWYCDACGKYFSDEALTNEITKEQTVIKATGHSETELKNVKEATCTEEGYTGDKVCKACGEVLEKGEVIAKAEHNFKDGKCTVCNTADPNYKPDTDLPQTLDSSNFTLCIALLFVSGAGLFGATVYNKKRKYNK